MKKKRPTENQVMSVLRRIHGGFIGWWVGINGKIMTATMPGKPAIKRPTSTPTSQQARPN